MKRFLVFLMLITTIATGCTANVVGKFDDYNEVFQGTIDLDLQGHGIIKAKTIPNNITCSGTGWVTFIPLSSYLLGTCKGQQGLAEIKCNDGRVINGEWVCEACTRVKGTGVTNYNENITFYITPKKSTANKITQQYISEIKEKPSLYNSNKPSTSGKDLF